MGSRPAPAAPAAAGRDRSSGQATVELVLALPVVVVSFLLVIQVAIVARAQVLVVNAAREAARAAAVEGTQAAATNAVRRAPGIDAGQARIDARIGQPGGLAAVAVAVRVHTDVPLVGPLLGDPIVRSKVVMRVEGGDQLGTGSAGPG